MAQYFPGLSMSSSFPVTLPSDLTVHTFNYSHKCFPRWNRLVRNLKCRVPLELKVCVVCRAGHAVNKSDFALETDDEGKESFNELKPSTVFVCILQCDKNGSLTEQDRHLLDYVKSNIVYAHQHDLGRIIISPFPVPLISFVPLVVEPNIEEPLFVIVGTLTDMELCRVSEEINEQMKFEKNHNYVLHRMFLNKSDEIGIRISLLLEERTIKWIEFHHGGSHREDIGKFKTQNKVDLQYHQFKTVSLRNKMICEFGVEGSKLIVSIEDLSKQDEVRNYLQKYIDNAKNVEILQFEEMEIEYLSLKSGDKVTSSINERFGTVGLFLRDENHYYCTTCKHVIDDCLGSSNAIHTPEYECKDIIITTQGARFETDRVFTPSENLDFSAIKLVETDIPNSSGLRGKDGDFAHGDVLSKDIPTLPHGTELYKWGANSGLTKGVYTGFRERRHKRIYITIEGENFALKGDSGSLICYSDTECEIAAMILIGKGSENMYVCHKLTDALASLDRILEHDTNLSL